MKKTIIIGITSSIAAYKSVQLVSDLIKKGFDVEVIMSENACAFIQPLTFSSLTKHKTHVATFEQNIQYDIEHIALAKKASLFLIAPATANVIAKVAHGICDDLLTTTFLACDCPKLIAPAMNTKMYDNKITQDNLQRCKHYSIEIIEPTTGVLACGDRGRGKMVTIETLIDVIEETISEKNLLNKRVLITAGPTIERIDPVRYISNHSSGKMGYALAKVARNMGADVTLISGPTHLNPLRGIKTIFIESAEEMLEACKHHYENQDYIIKAAAVSDFRSQHIQEHKIKKQDHSTTLSLEENTDILAFMGNHKTKQKICGFAMETQNEIEYAKQKMINKNCDMIVVNNILSEGAGFQCDTNIVTILTKDTKREYPKMSKEDLATSILTTLMEI